jgi:Rieske Fe-S protein
VSSCPVHSSLSQAGSGKLLQALQRNSMGTNGSRRSSLTVINAACKDKGCTVICNFRFALCVFGKLSHMRRAG